jgi:hypothetical protein
LRQFSFELSPAQLNLTFSSIKHITIPQGCYHCYVEVGEVEVEEFGSGEALGGWQAGWTAIIG